MPLIQISSIVNILPHLLFNILSLMRELSSRHHSFLSLNTSIFLFLLGHFSCITVQLAKLGNLTQGITIHLIQSLLKICHLSLKCPLVAFFFFFFFHVSRTNPGSWQLPFSLPPLTWHNIWVFFVRTLTFLERTGQLLYSFFLSLCLSDVSKLTNTHTRVAFGRLSWGGYCCDPLFPRGWGICPHGGEEMDAGV